MTIAAVALFLSLGLDTFAVAVSLGVKGVPRQLWTKIGLTFALFEGFMPVAGLLIGRRASMLLGGAAAYAAGIILIALGGWEIREAVTEPDQPAPADVSYQARSLW